MRTTAAWAAYTIGAVLALQAAIRALADGGLLAALLGLMWALAIWWFTVGLGVRLGLEPSDWWDDIRSGLGFRRPAEDNQDQPAGL